MRFFLGLANGIDRINTSFGRLASWLVLAMVAIGAWNAIGRHVGSIVGANLTSNALVEGQWYLFALVFFLGGAYVLKRDGHVRVDVFYSRWSPRKKAWANLAGTVLFLLPFCVMVLYASWEAVARSWQLGEVSPDPDGLPRYPIKTFILVSFALLFLQGISQGVKAIAVLRNSEDSTGDREP